MNLNDTDLLRNQCYIDGEWSGKPETPVHESGDGR